VAKDADRAEICDAIRGVAAGRTVVSGEALTSMSAELRHRRTAEQGVLTPREEEILGLLATGASAPDIGARLHVSTATVTRPTSTTSTTSSASPTAPLRSPRACAAG
jgi:DNA-binding NarL/FixJ family response regulator